MLSVLVKNCLYITDPIAISAMNEDTTSFTVEVTPPEGNPGIAFYSVEMTCGRGCSIPAGREHLRCLLTGLEPATSYNIKARACVSDDGGCTEFIKTMAVTRPRGRC